MSDWERFRILFVDDEPKWCDIAHKLQGKFKNDAEVVVISDVDLACEQIRNGYFQLAIVDLHFRGTHGTLLSGKTILSQLAISLPECERVVHSAYVSHLPDKLKDEHSVVAALYSPIVQTAHGVINKLSGNEELEKTIRDRIDLWKQSRARVTFHDPDTITDFFKRVRAVSSELEMVSDQALATELTDLTCAVLYGQGLPSRKIRKRRLAEEKDDSLVESEDYDQRQIDLEELRGGASTAYVALGQPSTEFGGSGVWCVIKYDLREKIEDELHAYHRFVKFQVTRGRRVELLGSKIGSRLGAICYTFGGESPEQRPVLLKDISEIDLVRAARIISKLFATKDLHGVSCPSHSILRYMNKRFGDRAAILTGVNRAKDVLRDVAIASRLVYVDGTIFGEKGQKFVELSQHAAGESVFAEDVPYCLSHGDLHGGNVLVGASDEVVLIDYRDTGPAPRTLDFVVAEASMRIAATDAKSVSVEEILKSAPKERTLWKIAWGRSPQSREADALAQLTLVQLAALKCIQGFRDVFEEQGPEETEYAAMAFAWCCYLLPLRSISDVAKLQLAVWMATLSTHFGEKK